MKILNRITKVDKALEKLALLRIAIGLVIFVHCFNIAPHILDLYGSTGFMQNNLRGALSGPLIPTLEWLYNPLAGLISFNSFVLINFFIYATSACFMLLGMFTRPAVIVAWALHYLLGLGLGHSSAYGFDIFLQLALTYLIIAPSGHRFALLKAKIEDHITHKCGNIIFRVMQFHLSLAYVATGIEKAIGKQWWDGEVIWRAMNLPIHQQVNIDFLASVPVLAMVLSIGTLIIEIGYPVFMWNSRLRTFGLISIISLHLGIAVFLGLHFFSFLMIVLNLFLFPFKNQAIWFENIFQSHWLKKCKPILIGKSS